MSRHVTRRLMEMGYNPSAPRPTQDVRREPFFLPFNGSLSADERRMADQGTYDDYPPWPDAPIHQRKKRR